MDWVTGVDASLEKGKQEDFEDNIKRAYSLIEGFFKKHTCYFKLTVFCGTIPTSSWKNRCYIKIITRLPATGIDVFRLKGINNLTDFGKSYISEIKNEFSRIVDSNEYKLVNLFSNKKERETIARLAENIVRKKMGIKNVGDAFVNETLLAHFTKKMFHDIIRKYNTK